MAILNPIGEAMRQVSRGEDFWSLDMLTRDLSPEQACKVPDGVPYAIATQVGHMLFWQDRWLDEIQGQPVAKEYSEDQDFPSASADQWMECRARLVAGIEMASSIAAGLDSDREAASGAKVGKILLRIAIHNSYHIGQIALIRQMAGLGMPVTA